MVAALAATLGIVFFPKLSSDADSLFWRPAIEDAVRVVALATRSDAATIKDRYKLSVVELSDQLCIGFQPTGAVLDGTVAVCYPTLMTKSEGTLHMSGRAILVSRLDRPMKR